MPMSKEHWKHTMTTTIKLQLSFLGNKLKRAFLNGPIEISERPMNFGLLEPFKSPHCITNTDKTPPHYFLNEVLEHDTPNDCWVIVYDNVYDLTNFLKQHPGGDEVILEYAGRDATLAFRSVGHSKLAETALEPYLIGVLHEKERLWTHLWGVNLVSR